MFTLNCKGRLLEAKSPLVMGIINSTPDSFYPGSRFNTEESILLQVEKMLIEGADLIDVGAQSTRPDAMLRSAKEELADILPVIRLIHGKFPEAIISVDTFYSFVASACVEAGASVINDVSGGEMDKEMIGIAGKLNTPYICMHMRGTPQTMQQYSTYTDLIGDLTEYFIHKVAACRKAGIKDVLIDPGFGFSKNIEQNFYLLARLKALKIVDAPLIVGLSRKSTIYKTLGTDAASALNGTTVLHTIALLNGADILRVHDVKEARECITLVNKMALPFPKH